VRGAIPDTTHHGAVSTAAPAARRVFASTSGFFLIGIYIHSSMVS
jgi:hypothetical protein